MVLKTSDLAELADCWGCPKASRRSPDGDEAATSYMNCPKRRVCDGQYPRNMDLKLEPEEDEYRAA